MSLALGLLIVIAVLYDAFGTIVLPRSVRRTYRFSVIFLSLGWEIARAIGKRCERVRVGLYAAFAPAALLALVGLWALLLILGLALVQYGLQSPLSRPDETGRFTSYLYLSGTTFLTLGYGDLTPTQGVGRVLAVGEAMTGFIFLALIIGYVPVLYGPFARREQTMLRLDARAGGDPTGVELILRHRDCPDQLIGFLAQWEEFAAALLEGYLSYPILAYYRSQHDEQSWLRSLTAVMDGCALLGVAEEGATPALRLQAHATFAMARHLLVDLAYLFNAHPVGDGRLNEEQYARIRTTLAGLLELPESPAPLAQLRHSYEPFVAALAEDLALNQPAWILDTHVPDNWQTSAWDGEHF